MRQSFSSSHYNRAENSLLPAFGPILPSLNQFRLLPKILSQTEKRIALYLTLLILISSLALGYRIYENKTILAPQEGGEFNEGVIGNPKTANPLLATSDADLDLVFLTHRGLFRTDENGQIIKDLAEEWSLSQDKKTYFVKIKSGLLWSDGQPLTAADAVFTFESAKQTKLASPLAGSFRNINISLLDDGETISFNLKEPYSPFLHALTIGLIPRHIWQNIPYEKWQQTETNLKPIGAGPWRISSLTRDGQGNLRSYSLEQNPYSVNEKTYFKKLNLKFFPNMTNALEALRQGSIDALGDLSIREKASLNPRRFIIYDITLPQYTAIFYNPNTNNALRDPSIRQALSYAINRPALIQRALSGKAQPAIGPFVFGELKNRTSAGAITYDQTKSLQLFEKAGYTRSGQNNYLMKDGEELKISLTVIDYDEQIQVANEIKRQWAEVGVQTEIKPVAPLFLMNDVINPRNYEAILITQVMGLDPDPYPFWHSSQIASPGLNLAQFQNREADQLLVEARQISEMEARQEKYIKFLNILRQESPATFLYSLNYSYVQNNSIKGFARLIMGQPAERFWDTPKWYKKTVRTLID